jgi:superfamily II DNA or RNA helicase
MYLEKHLRRDFPSAIRDRGDLIYDTGRVINLSGNQWGAKASVQGTRLYEVELWREKDDIRGTCDCPYYDSEGLCKHLWALVLAADAQSYLLGKFGGGSPHFVPEWEDFDDPDFIDDELEEDFKVFAPRHRALPPSSPWRMLVKQGAFGLPARSVTLQWPVGRELYYMVERRETLTSGNLTLSLAVRDRKKDGTMSVLKSERIERRLVSQLPDEQDREIVLALAGAAGSGGYGWDNEAIAASFGLRFGLWEMLLPKVGATGRCRLRNERLDAFNDTVPLQWDSGPAWRFVVRLLKSGKGYKLEGLLQRGEERMPMEDAAVLLSEGLLVARGKIARFDHGDAFSWIQQLRQFGDIQVPAGEIGAFVDAVLEAEGVPEIDWPEDLRFESVEATPRPGIRFSQQPQRYSPQSQKVVGRLFFEYEGVVVQAHRAGDGVYDSATKRYLKRNRALERQAPVRLAELGLKERIIYPGGAGEWEMPLSRVGKLVPILVHDGWHVESEGKLFRQAVAFRAELTSGIDWFELRGGVDFGIGEIALPELLKALERGGGMVSLSDGSLGVLPDELMARYGALLRLGRPDAGHLRFSRSQAGLLDVLLAEREEIGTDEAFRHARAELRKFETITAAEQPAGFEGHLRDYQREGLGWMQFLEKFGLGGCLADDMGTGKTPQVLARLEQRRTQGAGPSLVVVPRSLVYNWKLEAARFTPQLRVLDHTGVERARGTEHFENYDVVLATYGTMRRDAVDLKDHRFDYVILDESQAIKNAASESAKAARLLQANHRLAMTGTPIENHLGELWSLFEFLNPGMMGSSSLKKGLGDSLQNPSEETRRVLARAMRPYILRRTKEQVTRELPEKLEQTIYCELEDEQRRMYNELLEHYRKELLGRVDAQGMAKSRIQILTALLRLRQAACHPGLIDKKKIKMASAKTDMLNEHLREVLDEGHKALVFSQFTSFLSIVRQQLDKDKVPYEYLDGQTGDRQARVEHFQNDGDCKLFLISLKAGGFGLNLTAADYVFLLDPWWNPAVESQAIDRTHRIGQERRVFAYRLIARETVEEKVLELQKKKRDLADAIIGEDNRLIGNLKREDLELLLS